jgi:hypothetical protein
VIYISGQRALFIVRAPISVVREMSAAWFGAWRRTLTQLGAGWSSGVSLNL